MTEFLHLLFIYFLINLNLNLNIIILYFNNINNNIFNILFQNVWAELSTRIGMGWVGMFSFLYLGGFGPSVNQPDFFGLA